MTFLVEVVSFWSILTRKQERSVNIHPSIRLDHTLVNHPEAISEDHVSPCLEGLERLETMFSRIISKPAEIPLDKEWVLLDSWNRIKTIEYDPEKTKKSGGSCLQIGGRGQAVVAEGSLGAVEALPLYQVSRIIVATDSDPPGHALAEELSRRLGKERCWRVNWSSGCKDANEVLMLKGRDTLKELIVNPEMYPIRGLYKFRNFFEEIDDYCNLIHGDELGLSTGWRALDEFYKVPGKNGLATEKKEVLLEDHDPI